MLRQRTIRTTNPPAPVTPSSTTPGKAKQLNNSMAIESDSLLPSHRQLPSLPTTISSLDDAFEPTLPGSSVTASITSLAAHNSMDLSSLSRKSQWITLAIASGACAAFNGVFAKLTTTSLTASIGTRVASFLGLESAEKVVEYACRAMFFGLNLVFNGVMWALFTKALARGTSTTQVSIINTSANFMITAILGFFIFTESLPPLWWLGAAMLVVGNVLIGRSEEEEVEDEDAQGDAEHGYVPVEQGEEEVLLESGDLEADVERALKRREEEEAEADILDLGDDDTPHPSQGPAFAR